jgi:hypothetical protein
MSTGTETDPFVEPKPIPNIFPGPVYVGCHKLTDYEQQTMPFQLPKLVSGASHNGVNSAMSVSWYRVVASSHDWIQVDDYCCHVSYNTPNKLTNMNGKDIHLVKGDDIHYVVRPKATEEVVAG